MNKKTVKELEIERGLIFTDNVDLDKSVNDAEFKDLLQKNKWVGVDHKSRVEFLKRNNYAVTRENMVDVTLRAGGSEQTNTEAS